MHPSDFAGRFEGTVIMALLESDLVDLMMNCIDGHLLPENVHIRDGAAAAVVISSPGYPSEHFQTNLPITGVEEAAYPIRRRLA